MNVSSKGFSCTRIRADAYIPEEIRIFCRSPRTLYERIRNVTLVLKILSVPLKSYRETAKNTAEKTDGKKKNNIASLGEINCSRFRVILTLPIRLTEQCRIRVSPAADSELSVTS